MSSEETARIDVETGEVVEQDETTEGSDTTNRVMGTDGDDINNPGTASAALQVLLDDANKKAAEMEEAFLRARADYANLKRRSEEERDNLRSYVAEDIIKRLLPIADNFERALLAAEQTKEYEKLVGGVNGVYKQLQTFLEKEGVSAIEAVGQPFDAKIHDAVLREETADHPDNTVLEELQKGYLLNGKVIRPTMVKVATSG